MIWLPRRNAWSCGVVVVVVEVERLVGGDLSLPEHHQNQLRRLVQKNSNSLLYKIMSFFILIKDCHQTCYLAAKLVDLCYDRKFFALYVLLDVHGNLLV